VIPADRVYLDSGDRLAGRYDPPRLCVVTAQWGPGAGPRNVAVRYLDDDTIAVIPFPRRLRRAGPTDSQQDRGTAARSKATCRNRS
jgi:hypothetical protein